MSGAQERIQEMLRRFEEQATAAAQLKDKMGEIRGEARSRDGAVTATVAPSGAVLDLKLGPEAVKQSHTALQAAIMQTIREATQQAAETMNATVEPVLGDRAEQFREAFNAGAVQPMTGTTGREEQPESRPAPSGPAQAKPAAARREQDWDDDDFSGQSFLR